MQINSERDNFIIELMNNCVHEGFNNYGTIHCIKCNQDIDEDKLTDFSTWDGFGLLWEWSKAQTIETEFNKNTNLNYFLLQGKTEFGNDLSLINPDKFANKVYDYFKENIKFKLS
jgi:hypothetical protein